MLALINTFKDEKHPPMGIVSIATYLKNNMDIRIKVIDATWENIFKHDYDGYDIIGISSMTAYYNVAEELASKIKRYNKKSIVIVGGIHISMLPESLSKDMDIGVVGEGEETALELMKLFASTSKPSINDLKKIDGLVFWNGDELVKTKERELIKDLDKLPMKDMSILDKRYFRKKWIFWNDIDGVESLLLTSRGCSYDCSFCSVTRFWKRVRFHSPEYAVREIKHRYEQGIDHFQLNDDTFTLNKERIIKMTELLEKEGLRGKVFFSCQPRSNLVDEEMIKILKDFGIRSMNFGFESGNESILQSLKGKNITIEDHKRAVILGKKYDIKVLGSFIYGSPEETLEEMKDTTDLIKWMYDNGAYKLWNFVMTPFPGTIIWEIAKQRGKVSNNMDWKLLRHENIEESLLLEDDIDLEEFQRIFLEARDICDKNWMKGDWLKDTITHDPKRIIRKAFEDPKRAFSALRGIIKKRVGI